MVWLIGGPGGAWAQNITTRALAAPELTATDAQLKAAFLYNFAKFTEWPRSAFTNATAPLVFGVLGRNPFGTGLETALRDKTIGGRPVQLARFRTVDEVDTCHVLFISDSERPRMEQTLKALAKRPVLTVSDVESFAARGGMLGFYREGDQLRFEANPDAAQKAGVKLSSRLLNLAKIVRSPEAR